MKAIRVLAKYAAIALAAIAIALSTRADPPQAVRIAPTTLPLACANDAQGAFDLALELLHSQLFPLAANAFLEVLRRDPACAMGHWGIAMSAMGDVRSTGPGRAAVAAGAEAIGQAKRIGGRTEQECELIDGAAEYFHRYRERDHAERVHALEGSLRRSRERFPTDAQIRTFHSRALDALVDH